MDPGAINAHNTPNPNPTTQTLNMACIDPTPSWMYTDERNLHREAMVEDITRIVLNKTLNKYVLMFQKYVCGRLVRIEAATQRRYRRRQLLKRIWNEDSDYVCEEESDESESEEEEILNIDMVLWKNYRSRDIESFSSEFNDLVKLIPLTYGSNNTIQQIGAVLYNMTRISSSCFKIKHMIQQFADPILVAIMLYVIHSKIAPREPKTGMGYSVIPPTAVPGYPCNSSSIGRWSNILKRPHYTPRGIHNTRESFHKITQYFIQHTTHSTRTKLLCLKRLHTRTFIDNIAFSNIKYYIQKEFIITETLFKRFACGMFPSPITRFSLKRIIPIRNIWDSWSAAQNKPCSCSMKSIHHDPMYCGWQLSSDKQQQQLKLLKHQIIQQPKWFNIFKRFYPEKYIWDPTNTSECHCHNHITQSWDRRRAKTPCEGFNPKCGFYIEQRVERVFFPLGSSVSIRAGEWNVCKGKTRTWWQNAAINTTHLTPRELIRSCILIQRWFKRYV
jgi:hypothetical protein